MRNYRGHGYTKYLLHYHLLWCPKDHLSFQEKTLGNTLTGIIREICSAYGYDILMLEVQPRFIHVSLSVQPTVAPTDIIRNLKSLCTIRLLRFYPELKKHYCVYGSLWKKGCLVSTREVFNAEDIWRKFED